MKKIHIIAILMIAVSIGVLIAFSGDVSTYATFKEARTSGQKVKIVGVLSKDKEMIYDPVKDPNYFSFFIKDSDGEERKVVLKAEKPQDFELSEQIVLTGKMKDDEFIASDMLMKCPSKYKDEEVFVRSKS